MCCFSSTVDLVSDTHIFARRDNGRQFLVYSMTYGAQSELAMVLPLPVPPRTREDAVRFINLDRYPTLFDDLAAAFPELQTRGLLLTLGRLDAPRLKVHDVGDYEASFVPSLDAFNRLDERFRIPRHVWAQIPGYTDYGFAVFKLKKSRTAADRVHPMAFEFPQRDPSGLYFPTVHIHDRTFHRAAEFDHALYYQAPRQAHEDPGNWQQSRALISSLVDVERTGGIVDPNQHCWRVLLKGRLENRDSWVGSGYLLPRAA